MDVGRQKLRKSCDVQRPFRAKRLRATDKSRNFSSVFDVQRPFRAKGLPGTLQNRNFT